jgi:hypothetical protein
MRESDLQVHARVRLPVKPTSADLRRKIAIVRGPEDLGAPCPRAMLTSGSPQGVATQPKGSLMTKSVSTSSAPARVIVADSTKQFRLRNGETTEAGGIAYVTACRHLSAWARTDAENKVLVHALVHLGWCSTKGARAAVTSSSSKAWEHAKAILVVGKDAPSAADQITSVLEALAEAGAPAEALETVWATITA